MVVWFVSTLQELLRRAASCSVAWDGRSQLARAPKTDESHPACKQPQRLMNISLNAERQITEASAGQNCLSYCTSRAQRLGIVHCQSLEHVEMQSLIDLRLMKEVRTHWRKTRVPSRVQPKIAS